MAVMTIQQLFVAAGPPAAALPTATHRCYPIPLLRSGGYAIAFMYCPCSVTPEEGLWLYPPDHMAELDAYSGQLLQMRAIVPADFDRTDAPDALLGQCDLLPNGRTGEQYRELRRRLLEAYNLLLPAYATGISRLANVRQPARDFLELFPQVSEQPLEPYYQDLGRDFFTWVKQAR